MIFVLFSGFLLVQFLLAQDPGTAADPLVTKSYLDQFFRFRPLVLAAKGNLHLPQGSLIVLRAGRLKIRSSEGKSLLDLTEGKEIPPDSFIPASHLIMAPDSGDVSLEAQTPSQILAMGLIPWK